MVGVGVGIVLCCVALSFVVLCCAVCGVLRCLVCVCVAFLCCAVCCVLCVVFCRCSVDLCLVLVLCVMWHDVMIHGVVLYCGVGRVVMCCISCISSLVCSCLPLVLSYHCFVLSLDFFLSFCLVSLSLSTKRSYNIVSAR